MKIEADLKQTNWDEMLNKAVQTGLTKVSIKMRNYAIAECPVDTGRLLNSITREQKENEAKIFTDVEYAVPVEFGTKRQADQSFMRPALYNHEKEYENMINKEILSASARAVR